MNFYKYFILATVCTIFLVGCGEDSSLKNTTKKVIPIDDSITVLADSFIATTPPKGSLGLMIYDLTADREVYSLNKHNMMRPASCLKLLTCTAALHYLGTNKQWRNRMYIDGTMKGDTLVGNVILKTEFDGTFTYDSLRNIVDTLKNRGVKIIRGDVLLDMTITQQMQHEQHWIIGDLRTRYMGLLLQGLRSMKKNMTYALNSKGITVREGTVKLGRLNPHTAQLIAENDAPMNTMIGYALKNSSNINAESLLYPLGYIVDKDGNYRSNGRMCLQNFIKHELKITPSTAVAHIDDGCGLCPDNKVTPALLCTLLRYIYHHPNVFKVVYESMPIAGVDGTLHNRMYKEPTRGMLRGKTGTMTREGGVSTLSGYYYDKQHHLMAYVIMNNECPVYDGRQWQDNFCKKVLLHHLKK